METEPGAEALLTVGNLQKSYGDRAVIADLSFTVFRGDSLVLLGPSGCGKTTLLKILQGQIAFDSGRVEFFPQDAPRSLVAQDYGLFPWKTARGNLELPLLLAGVEAGERRKKCARVFSELGLAGLEGRHPGELSGGERQRLALGRSLIMEPSILFLDEPFSAADPVTREGLEDLLLSLRRKLNLTLVFCTHSLEEAALFGERILVLWGRPARLVRSVEFPAAGRREAGTSPEFLRRVFSLRKDLEDLAREYGAVRA
ncbi:MAG: ABC transporter ATP-binding protein [Deltaproteobacteria bacterium]|nr:ABC transporter ATP-binding protein [Deltaproteobacteria bacterium]